MADRFEALRAESEVADLRKLLSDTQRRLVDAQDRTRRIVDAVYDAARAAAEARPVAPAVPRPPKDERKTKAEIALVHLSDWQVGKVTADYNIEAAAKRVRRMAEKVEVLTQIERADHPVREAHVMLGGDMSEGVTIFAGQRWEVQAGAFQQVFATVDMLEDFLRRMLSLFGTVHVWQVSGNHGVVGKRGEHPREDNWDNFIYEAARRSLQGSERLRWHWNTNWHQIVKVGRYHAMLVHGDQVKSFGGNLPSFGIARKVNAWATGVVPPFTDCWMGHFHQPLVIPMSNGGRIFVSPSLESDNQYAAEFVAALGRPSQRLFFIDPVKGRPTAERMVWLDG